MLILFWDEIVLICLWGLRIGFFGFIDVIVVLFVFCFFCVVLKIVSILIKCFLILLIRLIICLMICFVRFWKFWVIRILVNLLCNLLLLFFICESKLLIWWYSDLKCISLIWLFIKLFYLGWISSKFLCSLLVIGIYWFIVFMVLFVVIFVFCIM